MLSNDQKTVHCSVGILTFNSEEYLRRALESVKDFTHIIISDGGSTDSTLDIAEEYGCTIIDQYTKYHPGPVDFHPIEDFARERNRMLDVAKEDWFLWIDSDEYISELLHNEIVDVTSQSESEYYAYEIPIAVQSPDAKITYNRDKVTHQIRFFNLRTGGRFQRYMHERFEFNKDKFPIGRLAGVWCVPISKSTFYNYNRVVKYRIEKMLLQNPPSSLYALLRKGVVQPFKGVVGILYRCLLTQCKYAGRSPMPLYYYLFQLYSQLITSVIVFKLYFKVKLGRITHAQNKNSQKSLS